MAADYTGRPGVPLQLLLICGCEHCAPPGPVGRVKALVWWCESSLGVQGAVGSRVVLLAQAVCAS